MSSLRARMAECARRGLTKAETAQELGCARESVKNFSFETGTVFTDGRFRKRPAPVVPVKEPAAPSMGLNRACQILAGVAHPKWSPADDLEILTAKSAGQNFMQIAGDMGLGRLAVEQRWHRLRIVPLIEDALRTAVRAEMHYPALDEVTF